MHATSFFATALAAGAFFAAVPAAAQNWTAEVYGGAVLERSEDYGALAFDLDSGTALGFGIYERNLVPNVELGIDVMSTDARYTGFNSGVESLSLMLNARLPFQISTGTDAYIGAGLGAIRVTYDGSTDFPAFTGSETKAGMQVSLGVRYTFAATTGVFAELKHQFAFEDATIVGFDQSYSSTSAIVGLRFSF